MGCHSWIYATHSSRQIYQWCKAVCKWGDSIHGSSSLFVYEYCTTTATAAVVVAVTVTASSLVVAIIVDAVTATGTTILAVAA